MIVGERVERRPLDLVRCGTSADRAASQHVSHGPGSAASPRAIRTSPRRHRARRASSTARLPRRRPARRVIVRRSPRGRGTRRRRPPDRDLRGGSPSPRRDRSAARGRRPALGAHVIAARRDRRAVARPRLRRVDVGRNPASPSSATTRRRSTASLDALERGIRLGEMLARGRRGPPRPAAHRQPRGTRRRRRNARSSPSSPSNGTPPSHSGRCSENRWTSKPRPVRGDGVRHRRRRSAPPRGRGRAST